MVVLPAPFGPRKPITSPAATFSVTSCTATVVPKCFVSEVRAKGVADMALNLPVTASEIIRPEHYRGHKFGANYGQRRKETREC